MAIDSRNPTMVLCHLTSFLFISSVFPLFSEAANTITQGQLLRDGETILSPGQKFELGFFRPANSTLRYLGIWYNNISVQTVVWVANREKPLSGKNGILTIGNNSNLMVLDGNGNSLWSSNASETSVNSTATLEDTGNLILSRSADSSEALWQSLEDMPDTFLPGMRLPLDNPTGENHLIRSWKSETDPSPGNYTAGIDARGSHQVVTWEGSKRLWRSGYWNGVVFLGVPSMRSFHSKGFDFPIVDNTHSYITYTPFTNETTRFHIWWNGSIGLSTWNETRKDWKVLQFHPENQCEEYNKCGDFGVCSMKKSAVCDCVKGFHPENQDQWNIGNWSGGCVRRTPLPCRTNGTATGDVFAEVENVNLPDFADVVVSITKEEDCEEKCLRNCSCNAYAFVEGIQCMMWSVDLVDILHFSDGAGKTLYVRLDNSESAVGSNTKISTAGTIAIAVTGTLVLSVLMWLLWRFREKLKEFLNLSNKNKKLPAFDPSKSRTFSTEFSGPESLTIEGNQGSGPLPIFHFNYVAAATNNFADNNKLGQGGFGPVYKGTLPGGQEVAVKRLSRRSGQGLEEFKNEIILIAKLQHRNLVRLLGCCIEGEEKLLVYEYMPNKSLDFFLFDKAKQAELDWSKRFAIIEGIARGLLYLHRDSRLRIIHRDLKASNILLDEEMNPKISDFGMARIFGGNENEANTIRVVGTYGYMSPEYAMEGLFSVKSDVYSFGILLLEIVTGRRNNSFRSAESTSLIRHAWTLWSEGKAMELVDPSIVDSCSRSEVLRCIHVSMLCVQDSAVYRPTMSSVVLMLETELATLPMPREPCFSSVRSNLSAAHILLDEAADDTVSTSVTVTEVIGR